MRGRWVLIVVLLVLVAVLFAAGVVSWMGQREWVATQRELVGKGEKLSLKEMAPLVVEDERNFFGDSMWKEIVETRQGKAVEEGTENFVPAVPKDHQQLEALNAKLPPEEVAALKKKWPRFADMDFSLPRCKFLSKLMVPFRTHDEAWRKDCGGLIMDVLKPLEPLLKRVAALLERPEARFPLVYDEGLYSSEPHMMMLLVLGQVFLARARAELWLGRHEAAARDVGAMMAVSHTLRNDLFMISYLVRVSVFGMAVSVIDQGIAEHGWSEGDLVGLDRMFKSEDFRPGWLQALRGERGGFNYQLEGYHHGAYAKYEAMDQVVKRMTGEGGESGWRYGLKRIGMRIYIPVLSRRDQAQHNRRVQGMIDGASESWRGVNANAAYVWPVEFNRNAPWAANRYSKQAWTAVSDVARKAAYAQDRVAQARIAIALERYYLDHKEYPDSLAALPPKYLAELPRQILNEEPMHYRRTGKGAFELWSNGWNGVDDGAKPGGMPGSAEGDWVWGKA